MATDPMASEAWPSVSADHVVPPSVLFHTPPPAVPANTVVPLVGSVTSAVMRPLLTPYLPAGLTPMYWLPVMGAGPTADHAPPVTLIAGDVDAGVRLPVPRTRSRPPAVSIC